MSASFLRLKTLLWRLKRPALIPELIRRKLHKFTFIQETSKFDLNFYKEQSTSVQQVLEYFIPGYDIAKNHKSLHMQIAKSRRRLVRFEGLMGGSADLDLLYGLIYILKPKRLLETGVAYGWSSLAILLAIQNIPDSRLISIDMPYVNRNLDFLVGLAVPDHLQSKWTLLRLADRQGIPKALRRLGDIDFAHYDSDKSSDGRDFA